MGYRTALRAAGADIIAFEEFGDYQGTWYAKVAYEGKIFWVTGCYGSCSGCDAFQAEFDFSGADNGCEDHSYDKQENCEACKAKSEDYKVRLKAFGASYLDRSDQTQEELEKSLAERAADYDWDDEYKKAYEFVKANALSVA